jgi:ubiquinone/menaquinone biosynthesis C-methylase UbiE
LPQTLQVKGLAEIRRVLKPGGWLLIADMMRPGPSFLNRLLMTFMHHGHGMQFGIEDLSALLKEAGFEQIRQLD